MNYKHFSDIYTGEREFQREKMQFFFDKSFRDKDENLLRNQYVSLRQLEFLDDLTFEPECVDLSSLTESITVACDILSSESGVSFIYIGDSPCYVIGNSRLITKALLNLLSNAYLYGRENLVTVKTVEQGNCCGIEVLSGGSFSENHKAGNGLSFVRNICNKMHGNFFIEQTLSHTKAIMLFPKSDIKENSTKENADILSLVYNRLSPVCVEMFGMEYH
ncbi:MAG: HAMP domain-containing histidine kinase [Clostridia bacterium]|nr:HAMP domain-containing histidine kinase [Clostridia bacterium]